MEVVTNDDQTIAYISISPAYLKTLEDMLKEYIKRGRDMWFDSKEMLLKCRCTDYGFEDWCFSMWYDQLFSPDVWLMQFVKWQDTNTGLVDQSINWSEWIGVYFIDPKYKLQYQCNEYKRSDRQYHAMIMSIMSADEKVKYFVQNAIIFE